MKKRILFIFIAIMLVVLVTACGQSKADPVASDGEQPIDESVGSFKIGVIPAISQGDMEGPIKKLEGILDDVLVEAVELTIYPDYNGVVEALNFGHIQMAYLGPSTYVIANNRSNAQAIITFLINDKPYYNSYMITHVDNTWVTLDDVLAEADDIRFAFGDINSTSGMLVPSLALMELGYYTDENTHKFKEIRFTGSHDVTGQSVINKHVEVGAIDSAFYYSLIEKGVLDESKIRVIWESEPLFQYPWAVGADIDQQTIQLLQETFLAIDDQEILGAFGATGFALASDEDYEPIRQVMIKTGKLK